jgi:flagellar biosynthesis/type III secretory pathway protein FliH
MEKQTATDWLAEKYNYITWMRNRDEMSAETADKLRAQYIKEANQMHKEQTKSAYNKGYQDGEIDSLDAKDGDVQYFEDAEQYYNETYGKSI